MLWRDAIRLRVGIADGAGTNRKVSNKYKFFKSRMKIDINCGCELVGTHEGAGMHRNVYKFSDGQSEAVMKLQIVDKKTQQI